MICDLVNFAIFLWGNWIKDYGTSILWGFFNKRARKHGENTVFLERVVKFFGKRGEISIYIRLVHRRGRENYD
jgi:hypothetical protein